MARFAAPWLMALALLGLIAGNAAAHSSLLGARVNLRPPAAAGQPAAVTVELTDPYGSPVPVSRLLLVPAPAGAGPLPAVPLVQTDTPGRFSGAFTPDRPGEWSLRLSAELAGDRWQGEMTVDPGLPVAGAETALYPQDERGAHRLRDRGLWWEVIALLIAAALLRWLGKRRRR